MSRSRLHLICGNCGCNDMWKYYQDPKGLDTDGNQYPCVFLVCNNCSTLHCLDDYAEHKNE